MAASNASANLSDRELLFTRVFDAPRELVFDAWTDPRHLAQWWGPNGFRTTIRKWTCAPVVCGVSSCMARTAPITRTASSFAKW